ncbi:MAG: glycosyltransferase family 4 protein [Deltaproteobacteria bacterium]|nr:MAG: glycosyltransferase family 4 protein [Deltaproteobacteria bacterium]TMB37110.1 MAG: glycosyltransferase family 4 protein [Deltaproteobacteria bacterium]
MRSGLWLVLDLDANKRGSMEQQLIALARGLRDRRIPAVMYFAARPAAFPGDDLRKLAVDVRDLPFHRPALAARKLLADGLEERPGLVHLHFVRPYSPLVAAAAASGAKIIVHDHVSLVPRSGLRQAFKLARGRLLNPLVDLRLAVSEHAASTVRDAHGVPADRVRVVENAIDLSRFEQGDGSRLRDELRVGSSKLVVSVARLEDEKGGGALLRAFARVGGDAHLALVGKGSQEQAWKRLASELGIGFRVHFLGLRNDVEHVLAASDLVVVPSQWEEAFGLAVIEAMAAGKPVVVTRSGAMPAIVGDAGIVVSKHDLDAMASAIREVLADDASAAELAAKGRARVQQRYGMERYVREMLAIYSELLPQRWPRAA